MLSKRFGENLFDEMFDDPFELMPMFSRHNPLYGKHAKALMKTDVREKDNSYELDIDLPGLRRMNPGSDFRWLPDHQRKQGP